MRIPRGSFFVHLGYRKDFWMEGLFDRVEFDGAVFSAAAFSPDTIQSYVGIVASHTPFLLIDPCTFFDRSPAENQKKGYRNLPYGRANLQEDELNTPDKIRRYINPVLDYQRTHGANVLISPYVFCEPQQENWLRKDLEIALHSMDWAASNGYGGEVLAGLAVSDSFIVERKAYLLNEMTRYPFPGYYLQVHTNQPSFSPLRDAGVLDGIKEVTRVLESNEYQLLLAQRSSCGLGFLAQGLTAFSSGVSGNLQNFMPPSVEPRLGRKAKSRYYVPHLMNFVRVEELEDIRRSGLYELVQCDCSFCEKHFVEPERNLASDWNDELSLKHYLYCLQRQAEEIRNQPVSHRLTYFRQMVKEAVQISERLEEAGAFVPSGKNLHLGIWLTSFL